MKQTIEYGARFPESLDPDDPEWGNKWVTRKRDSREEAEGLVQYVNNRAKAGGFPERAYLVERVVMVSEWEGVSTGVPQSVRGGIEE